MLIARGGIPVGRRASAQNELIEATSNAAHFNGGLKPLEVVLKVGARINRKDSSGSTALITALEMGIYTVKNADVVKWLLEHGADPNVSGESHFKDLEGIPLHFFVVMNKYQMNPTNNKRHRPVIKRLSEGIMKWLLKAGAKVSGVDSQDRTPLHWAAKRDNFRAAQILIAEGAKVMPRDKFGKTPLDYAETARMIKLLKASGARE
ncbi:MAG: ankyrin repeat domain-containing protein [Nitrospinota bacterium]